MSLRKTPVGVETNGCTNRDVHVEYTFSQMSPVGFHLSVTDKNKTNF